MNTKTYRSVSRTQIGFNVIIRGYRRRISFYPSSEGFSMYHTSKPEEQQAIEAHPDFNRNFVLLKQSNEAKAPEPAKEAPQTVPQAAPVKAPQARSNKPLDPVEQVKKELAGKSKQDIVEAMTVATEIDSCPAATSYLRKKGYAGPYLRKKEEIKAKALEMKISFPNLI